MKAVGSINLAAIGAITETAATRTSNIIGLNKNNCSKFHINSGLTDIASPGGIFLN
jgi:hypothetical protein